VASTRNAARLRAVIIGIVAAGSAAFLIPTIAAAVPRDPATDTIASVTQRLDNLSKQSESLAEKYNGAQITLTARQKAAGKAQSAFRSAAATYQTARAQLTNTLKSQYEGAQFSTAGALLTSTNEANYLDKVEALNLLNAHRSAVVAGTAALGTVIGWAIERSPILSRSVAVEWPESAMKRGSPVVD